MFRDQFAQVLSDFGDQIKEDLYLDDETDTCMFIVDQDVVVNLQYLEESDSIVIFSPIGALGEDETAGKKAIALLKLNDLSNSSGQITLMKDPQADLILAADHQSAPTIYSADILASWIDILVSAVHQTRTYFAQNFPQEE